MRRLIVPDVPAILGAIVGGGMCALGIAIADPTGDRIPFTVLLVLSIALVGLLLGAKAALWAYVAGSTVMLVDAALPVAREQYDPLDLVRLLALIFGSPLIVLLVRRGEVARQVASEALAASHAAEEAGEVGLVVRAPLHEGALRLRRVAFHLRARRGSRHHHGREREQCRGSHPRASS